VKPQKIILPKLDDNIMKYNQYEKQEIFPFVLYADFECLLLPTNKQLTDKTNIYQEHKVCSFA
jgi:hypothetical protein